MIKSIECKNCKCDLWDVMDETATCRNCGAERPFYTKKAKAGSKSQKRAIQQIKRYFQRNWLFGRDELYRFEVEETEYGSAWVYVETTENIMTTYGANFLVGPRGKIEVTGINSLTSDKRGTAEHYAQMLGGSVWKHF